MAHPLVDDSGPIAALRTEYQERDQEAKRLWQAFDEARTQIIERGEIGKDVVARLDALHKTYKQAASAADEAKTKYLRHLGQASPAPGDPSATQLDSIAKAFVRQTGAEGFKAFTSGGAIVPAFFDPRIRELPQRQLFVRSLIPVRQATGELVQYVRQSVLTNAAAPVSAGGLKPTSTVTVERVEESVRVIAHVSEAIDRSILEDFEDLRSFLDGQLRYGVLLGEEQQIISGSGVAPNLRGILNTPGIGSVTKGGSEPAIEAIHRAITTCRLAFYEPDAVVVHPNDYQELRLAKNANGDYFLAPATQEGPPQILGKEVITSPVIAEGTGLVGAFAVGATVWEREDARITWAETGLGDVAGQELFTRNQLRARGEERIAFGVERPAAFCQVLSL